MPESMLTQSIKKNLTMFVVAVTAITLATGTISIAYADNEDKITICHVTSENGIGNTITISLNAYDNSGHADHEWDEEGACDPEKELDSDGDGLSDRDDQCPLDSTNTCNDPSDTTAPEIISEISCSETGNNGWCIGDVTIKWSVNDPESPYTSDGCEDVTVDYDTTGVTFTCNATSEGGENSITTPEIKRDATAPLINSGSQSPESNTNGWNNTPVEVTFTCSDETSGVVGETLVEILSGEGEDQSIIGQCNDQAGNSSQSIVEGINIDMTAPVIGDVSETYLLNQPVEITCSDELSGILTCDGSLDTTDAGSNDNVLSATDLAGNETIKEASYNIHYDLACLDSDGGFKSPIPNTTYKVGRAIPEKFVACDYYGISVPTVIATSLLDGNNAPSVGKSSPDSIFKYDEIDMQYIFVLSSKGLSLGEHELTASLDSGQQITTIVNFKK